MKRKILLSLSSVISFLLSSCCSLSKNDAKIETLVVKRDSLLNIDERYAFQRLKDFELLQSLEDSSQEYIKLTKKLSNYDKVSIERAALILRVDKQIIDLQKQKQEEN